MGEEQSLEVDVEGFSELMKDFRARSKADSAFKVSQDLQLQQKETDYLMNTLKLPMTNDSLKYEWCTSGEGEEFETNVQAIYDGKEFVESCTSATAVGLVLDRTPLYAEQGGQIFDKAIITSTCSKATEFHVCEARKYAGYVLHVGTINGPGEIRVGEKVIAKVDYSRRALVAKNHTSTHILNFALRQVLGEKCDQKGSYVDEYRLRFDFSQKNPITKSELNRIEEICNQQVQMMNAIHCQEVGYQRAKAIKGLRACFGEVYPDPVRVVSVGQKVETILSDGDQPWGTMGSVEFCGGTHVSNTNEIYKFVLLTEEGIAKNVRRIVAVTGPQAAVEATLKAQALQLEVKEAKHSSGALQVKQAAELRHKLGADKEVSLTMKKDMLEDLESLSKDQMKVGKQAKKEHEKRSRELGNEIGDEALETPGDTIVSVVNAGDGDDAKAISFAMEQVVQRCPEKAVFLVSNSGGRLAVLARVPEKLRTQFSAKDWTDKVLQAVGGQGGGTPERAMGQSTDPTKIDVALDVAKSYLNN